MKGYFFITVALLINGACSPKINSHPLLQGKVFESRQGPLYKGNKIVLNTDSTFIFYGQGPSVFLSKGTWKYNPSNKKIVFISKSRDAKFVNPTMIDTLWIDLSAKNAMLVSPKKIAFENITYYCR